MASSFSPNLAIELIGTGDQAGQWGNTTNTNLGTLIEQSISGYVTQAVATGTDTTITIPNGATGVARNMYIELTGTGGASTNLIVPANKKLYFIFNNTASGQVTVKVSGQTGVSVPNKAKVILVSNGTDIIDATNYIGSAVIGNLTATSGTITTLASSSAVITQLNSTSGTISTLASTSAAITTLSGTTLTYASASITNLTATSLVLSNLSIASANITTLTSSSATISTTLALSAGTANGVLYLNASKVATSGSALTFDGTLLTVGGSNADLLRIQGTTQNLYFTPDSSGVFVTTATGGGGTGLYCAGSVDVLTFRTGGTEKMRLDSSGNLGIGTSTPSGFLANKLVIATGGTANEGMTIYSSSNNGSIWFADATTGTGRYAGGIDYQHSTDLLTFYSGTQGNMLLNSSGNLGLGVTPSAWAGKGFQISSLTSVAQDGNGFSAFSNNAYNDTSSSYKYLASSYEAALYRQSSGAHAWYTAPSGTAGNAITFTTAMTLDSNTRGILTVGPNGSSPSIGTDYATISAWNTNGGAFTIRRGTSTGTAVGYFYGDSTQVILSAQESVPLLFYTNNTERARITAGGYFKASDAGTYGFGATGTQHEFDQTGTSTAVAIVATNSTTYNDTVVRITCNRTTTDSSYQLLSCYNGDQTGIFRIQDSGNAQNTNNSYAGTSDIKLKQDVVDAASQWDDIKALRVRKYRFKQTPDAPLQIGLVAQETETVSPGLVEETVDRDTEGNDLGTTTKSVKYSVLYMKAVKALQEAMTRIENLEAEVAALKGV